MVHFAIRGLMHEAALESGEDPGRLSFLHSVRLVRRKMATIGAIPPRHWKQFHKAVLAEILDERAASTRNRRNQRGVKRKTGSFRHTAATNGRL